MNDFFVNLGGKYAFYIWTSYALTFVFLVANLIIPKIQQRNLLRTLARKLRRKRHDNNNQNP